MKKRILTLLAISAVITVTACGNNQTSTKMQKQNAVEKAISNQVNKEIDEQVKKLEDEEKSGTGSPSSSGSSTGSQIVTQNGQVLGATSDFEAKLKEAREQKSVDGIDYDLTTMGSDMIYATVYLMMTDPDQFEGKMVKMKGQYLSAYYEPRKEYYNYCFISDAAGCCSQGIEFATKDKLKQDSTRPKDNTDIEVVGKFETYMEDGKMYCHLKDSKMTILKDDGN